MVFDSGFVLRLLLLRRLGGRWRVDEPVIRGSIPAPYSESTSTSGDDSIWKKSDWLKTSRYRSIETSLADAFLLSRITLFTDNKD